MVPCKQLSKTKAKYGIEWTYRPDPHIAHNRSQITDGGHHISNRIRGQGMSWAVRRMVVALVDQHPKTRRIGQGSNEYIWRLVDTKVRRDYDILDGDGHFQSLEVDAFLAERS
jgi:hypothetical protein